MRGTLHRSRNSGSKQLAAIDQLLIAGINLGPAKKRDAINRVLELVPEWPGPEITLPEMGHVRQAD
jgi:hypothetical protein